MATNGTDVSVPVVFTTKTPYPLPSQKFMIPTTWKRYQLSQLINKALALERPIPFDFLVQEEILRTSLGQWCTEKGLGEEETLQIEYLESVMPPQQMSSLPHEDWVAAVTCAIPGHFLTTGYDGMLRGFDYSQKPVVSSVLHIGPTSSVTVVGTSSGEDSYTILTGSHDLSAKISRITLNAGEQATVTELASLHLHTGPISSVAASVSGQALLTASWDNLIGIWDAKIPEHDEVPLPPDGSERKKRRKVATERVSKRKAPVGVLKLHTARVSKVLFGSGPNEQGNAYSCGLDSTVRIWDVENRLCTRTITASEKPMLDMAVSLSGNTAMTASTDRTVTLYDLNSSDSANLSVGSLMHPATPSCIVRSPTQESHIATGAYDGIVRVWDLRSTKGALASFKAAENAKKVLSVDWVNDIIAAGGEGGLEVWKFADRANA